MKRRPFLNAAAASFALPQILIARSGNPMDRIAMTSVTFRFRFSQTSPDGKGDLVLTDIPAYFADEFGLTNVELWSKHFESQETSYLDQLKAKLTKAKTKLINVQVDEKYNLSDKDPAKRTASIDLCRGWIDTTAYLGAPSLRVNSGRGEKAICIESLKELTTYAKNKGLILLVENHGGLSSDPDQLLSLIEEVGDPDIRILADYANWPADADIYTALKKSIRRRTSFRLRQRNSTQQGNISPTISTSAPGLRRRRGSRGSIQRSNGPRRIIQRISRKPLTG